MVHIKDEGSHFDAPIDVVWKYIQAQDAHRSSHRSSRNTQMKQLGENSMEISMEQNMNGNWVKVANRITIVPPLGMAIEVIEGPMAGSKMVNIYTPKGNRTGIDVYGEFVSSQVPPAQLEPMVRGFLESMFTEDAAGIKAFASKK